MADLYTSKRDPERLFCEVCGVYKACVPCSNSRWCQRGRCPVCFPTILHQGSGQRQQELYSKIWDMEFVCEACCANNGQPPLLTTVLHKQEGALPGPLPGFPEFYWTGSGRLLTQHESQQQQQQPAVAASKQQQPQKQLQQQQPQKQQQQKEPQQQPPQQQQPPPQKQPQQLKRPLPTQPPKQPAAPTAAAAPATAKATGDAGEPPKKRLKQTGQAAAAAAKPSQQLRAAQGSARDSPEPQQQGKAPQGAGALKPQPSGVGAAKQKAAQTTAGKQQQQQPAAAAEGGQQQQQQQLQKQPSMRQQSPGVGRSLSPEPQAKPVDAGATAGGLKPRLSLAEAAAQKEALLAEQRAAKAASKQQAGAAAAGKQQPGPAAAGNKALPAAAAAAAGAEPRASSPALKQQQQRDRQQHFDPLKMAFMQVDAPADGADDDEGDELAAFRPQAAAAAAAAAAGQAAAGAEQGLRAAAAAGQSDRPLGCRLAVTDSGCSYVFPARFYTNNKTRQGVQFPRALQQAALQAQHNKLFKLDCSLVSEHTLLHIATSEADATQQVAVFNEPLPIRLTELALPQNRQLPTAMDFMLRHGLYLRVVTPSGSLFFGPVLRRNHHIVKYDYATPASKARHDKGKYPILEDELGLLMVKPAWEPTTPPLYGTVVKAQEDPEDQVQQLPPAKHPFYDDSFLQDRSMDEFYADEVYAAYLLRNPRALQQPQPQLQQPSWQPQQPLQQLRQPQLQAPPVQVAQQPLQQSRPQQQGRALEPQPESRRPQQRQQEQREYSPVLQPQEPQKPPQLQQPQQQRQPQQGQRQQQLQQQQQQQQQQQRQQQQDSSALGRLLAGGEPQAPLMPGPEQLLALLRDKGLSGLVVYMDQASFGPEYSDDATTQRAGRLSQTQQYVQDARKRGVQVFAPGDTPRTPPPGASQVFLVTSANMHQCGLGVEQNPVSVTERLVQGAHVLPEGFLPLILKEGLWKEGLLQEQPGNAAAAELATFLHNDSFHTSGVVLVYHSSLLLCASMEAVRALSEQLHALKPLLPAQAMLQARAQQEDLEAGSAHHLWSAGRWQDFAKALGGVKKLQPDEVSTNPNVPAALRPLSSARKVSFKHNKLTQSKDKDAPLPLRYCILVTAEPTAEGLNEQQRAAVRELTSNSRAEEGHKVVVGATLTQAQHFLGVLRKQLEQQREAAS